MKNWLLVKRSADYENLSKELNIDPVAVRIMVNRDITDLETMKDFLSDDISKAFDYKGLPDVDKAVSAIKEARDNNLRCRIVGDYDADGVCSSAILYKGLSLYGLKCDYYIPNRMTDGYGINTDIVGKALDDGIGFIITCDNGISAKEAIDTAAKSGIKVVVTDHHTPTISEIPTMAFALVNPKMPENKYPFDDICGAFVALKVLCALFENDSSFETLKEEMLELAAFATVTDVMPLVNENRKIVKWLLKRLKNPVSPGLKELMNKCGISSKEGDCTIFDIGFRSGPCVNAAGRIDIADSALDMFICDDPKVRSENADKLIAFNEERKALTAGITDKATEMIKEEASLKTLDKVIVVYLPECHISICGLVAGRIREKFYRPVIVLTDSDEGVLSGSGRSIDEYDMISSLQEIAPLMTKFGGHKAACGLSLKKENLEEFKKSLNDNSKLADEDLIEKIRIDADMPFGYVSKKVIEDINKLEPFGRGNPSPVFAQKDMTFLSDRRFGEDKTHAFVNVKDRSGMVRTLKLWRRADELEELVKDGNEGEVKLSVTYTPSINCFRGNENLEFTIGEFKLS